MLARGVGKRARLTFKFIPAKVDVVFAIFKRRYVCARVANAGQISFRYVMSVCSVTSVLALCTWRIIDIADRYVAVSAAHNDNVLCVTRNFRKGEIFYKSAGGINGIIK